MISDSLCFYALKHARSVPQKCATTTEELTTPSEAADGLAIRHYDTPERHPALQRND